MSIALRFGVIALVLGGSSIAAHAAQPSGLWGERGEKYDPAGPLPDFSFAGYERGEKPIPERAAEVSIKDFGATGDGKTDDTAAFQRALREAAGKVIGLPAGRYLLSDVLEISVSGTVLKGAGTDQTTLVFTKALQEIRPTTAETGDGKATNAWSWSGGLVWFKAGRNGSKVLASVAAAGAKRGATRVPVEDVANLKVGQEVFVEAKDPSSGSFVDFLFHGSAQDGAKMIGKKAYRYIARIRAIEGTEVVLDRPLRFDLRPEWSAVLRSFEPSLQQAGIEDLTFEFPKEPYRGHWEEDGFNAIEFENCTHCWARRLVIHNADGGIFTKGYFCTVSDVLFTANRRPASERTGHHGIQAEGADNLITKFRFKTRFFHELTISNSIGNVFSEGEGEALTLDHHKNAPYENLFTNLDAGDGGPAMWASGGPPGMGPHTAAGATFWNIRSKKDPGLPTAEFGPAGLVFAGLKGSVRKSEVPAGWSYESIRAGSLTPPNLHLAQLQRRLAAADAGNSNGAPQRWTTVRGEVFSAKFGGIQGANVIFILPDGRRAPYPHASLSAESRAVAARLAAPR